MKITKINYCCITCPRFDDRIALRVDAWQMRLFPMTYTVRECLEEFCESVAGDIYLTQVD